MASVVVAGGGVAGLTCAWRLRRAGHDVEVLEREPAPGGRMRSERHGGYQLARGAQFVASGYRNLHAVVRAVGLAGAVRPLRETRNRVLRDGRLLPADPDRPLALLRGGLLGPRAAARLPRVAWEVWRQRRRLVPLHPERARALDGEDFARWLGRVAGAEARDYFFQPAFSATFDHDLDELSAAFGLLVLRLALGGMRLQTLDGGVGALTAALAAQVPLRTGCEVLAVETEGDGARVRYRAGGREQRVVADAAVVAVPGSAASALCPKLTPAERGFLDAVRYNRGIIVHLLLERAPASLPWYGVAFPAAEGLGLYGLVADHHAPGAAPPGAGLVNAALTAQAAARLWDAPDDRVGAHVVDTLARTPVGRLAPERVVVHRWDPMLPTVAPGHLTRLARFLERVERSPRLAFAGDYLVGPFTEAAVTSGMRAADEIAAMVR